MIVVGVCNLHVIIHAIVYHCKIIIRRKVSAKVPLKYKVEPVKVKKQGKNDSFQKHYPTLR